MSMTRHVSAARGTQRTRRSAVAATIAIALVGGAALVGAGASASAAGGSWSNNLVANPSFETALTGWNASNTGTTLEQVWGGQDGNVSARVTVTKAGAIPLVNDEPNVVTSATKGALYHAVVYVRTPKSLAVQVRVREVTASGSFLGKQESSATVPAGVWTPIALDYTATTQGSQLALQTLSFVTTVGTYFDVDAIELKQWLPTVTPPPTTPPATTTPPVTTPPVTTPPATTPPPTTAPPTTPPVTTPACTVSATLVPSCGAWFGAAANPLGTETWDQALLNLESQTGRKMGIYHTYKKDGQLFPSAGEIARAREGRLILANWKPSTTLTWRQVADGGADGTIDAEAAYLKAKFTDKFFLTIWHEMEPKVNETAGSGQTAADFRDMYRHVVLRLRAQGVTNAVTVVNYMGTPYWGTRPWFETLYPGDDVVDWIAEDPYSFGTTWLVDFANNANRKDTYSYPTWPGFYSWATTKTNKPIMLSEYGVDDPAAKPTFKASFFAGQIAGMKSLPKIKAVVYWNQNVWNPVGTTRVDSNAGSLTAWKQAAADAYANPSIG